MKKLIVIALSVMMLFAFTACNNGASYTEVRNQEELLGALEAGDKNISITQGFEINEPFAISDSDVVINGNHNVLTISNDIAEAGYVINVTGSNVKMDGVDIEVNAENAALYVINASNSNSGFEFRNGSITSGDWSETLNEAGIAIGLNVGTDAKVINSDFQDCFTPIYVNGANVTLTDIDFNSGINFNAIVDVANLTNLTKSETADWADAKLNFDDVPGIQVTAEKDPLAAIRTKFPELTVVPALPEA